MSSFFQRPQSVWLRRALFQVHLWVGIFAGLYIVVVCVTGAALVFRINMQRAMFPQLFTPSSAAFAEPAAVLESLRLAYPNDRISGIDTPSTERPTYLAYVSRGNEFLTVLVDPATTRVLGLLPDRSLIRSVQELHFDLLGGRTGRIVNGVGAALLLLMCLTGLVIWWPGAANWRRGLTIDFRRSWKRVNWDLHSAIGIWTGAVIFMWALTGIYFVFPSGFRAAVNAVSPISATRSPKSAPAAPGTAARSWRELIERAEQRMPHQFVARIVVPFNDSAAFQVLFSNQKPTPAGSALTSVYLDQHTGEFLAEPPRTGRTTGDIIMAWVAPLHVGGFGGFPVKLAWLLLGLSPPVLFITGFIMWWTRVVRPRRAAATAAVLTLALWLGAGTPATAQTPASGTPQNNPVAQMHARQMDMLENDIVRLAEAMPADKYDFRPNGGAFGDVRTFGEQVKHVATMVYMTAALVLEEKSPYGPGPGDNGPPSIQGKAQIVDYLKSAMVYARQAMASLTVANHLDPLKTFFGSQPRIETAAGVIYHSYNHYGQMVVYARMNGVVPPASQR